MKHNSVGYVAKASGRMIRGQPIMSWLVIPIRFSFPLIGRATVAVAIVR
jgi:hypothetical protein